MQHNKKKPKKNLIYKIRQRTTTTEFKARDCEKTHTE